MILVKLQTVDWLILQLEIQVFSFEPEVLNLKVNYVCMQFLLSE